MSMTDPATSRVYGNPGHTVLTFDQPYNRHIEGPRVSSCELEDVVLKLAAAHAGSVTQQLPGQMQALNVS